MDHNVLGYLVAQIFPFLLDGEFAWRDYLLLLLPCWDLPLGAEDLGLPRDPLLGRKEEAPCLGDEVDEFRGK